jgi:hypothetical protein
MDRLRPARITSCCPSSSMSKRSTAVVPHGTWKLKIGATVRTPPLGSEGMLLRSKTKAEPSAFTTKMQLAPAVLPALPTLRTSPLVIQVIVPSPSHTHHNRDSLWTVRTPVTVPVIIWLEAAFVTGARSKAFGNTAPLMVSL